MLVCFRKQSDSAGRVLTKHTENVWGAERPFTWFGIDVNGRGAVVKLSDGSLWVHSPVKLDPELKTAMDALGPVKHIVTPNFEHNKYAQQACLQPVTYLTLIGCGCNTCDLVPSLLHT